MLTAGEKVAMAIGAQSLLPGAQGQGREDAHREHCELKGQLSVDRPHLNGPSGELRSERELTLLQVQVTLCPGLRPSRLLFFSLEANATARGMRRGGRRLEKWVATGDP